MPATGEHRATLHWRQHPDDGRAEHRSALDQRSGSAGTVSRIEAHRSCRTGRRNHRRHRCVPRHGHLQARHRVIARAGRRNSQPPQRKVLQARRRDQESSHQNQRLLQFLRPAPHCGSRFLRNQPHDRQSQGSSFSGRAWRQVAGERRGLRPRHRHGAVEANSGSSGTHRRAVRAGAGGPGIVPGIHQARRQAGSARNARTFHAGSFV